jgi:hypothetical protein
MSNGWYKRHASHCQGARGGNISRLASATILIALFLSTACQPSSARKRDDIPDRLFEGQNAPEQIASARVVHDRLVPPPMEETFFPTNFDGQAKVLNIDSTVNMTIAINQFYYNPKWRGEYWVPFDQVDLIERASRLMSTWKEYDEANQYKVLNRVNIFFERYSGFGP